MTSSERLVHAGHLLSTAEQLELIHYFNDHVWVNNLTEEQLHNIPVDSAPQDDISNLRVLHVDFGSTDATIEAWRWTYMSSARGIAHWNSYHRSVGVPDLRPNTHTYSAGIHEVSLDMVANNDQAPMDEVWARTIEQDAVLAHAEVLSALGLNRHLLQAGRDALFPVLGGYTLDLLGRERTQALHLDSYGAQWGLRFYSSTSKRNRNPVPVVHT